MGIRSVSVLCNRIWSIVENGLGRAKARVRARTGANQDMGLNPEPEKSRLTYRPLRLGLRNRRRYCFSSIYVETLPVSLLSATVVIFFPSPETVILSTDTIFPSRLKVASIDRSPNCFNDTVSFA